MVQITYKEDKGILCLTYVNSVDQEDIEIFMVYLQNHRLPDNLLILHHVGSADSSMNVRDLMYFSKQMKLATGTFQSVKAAVFVTNSIAKALSRIYERINMDRNTQFKTFDTEVAAEAWLLSSSLSR